jgi:hypothetical protein
MAAVVGAPDDDPAGEADVEAGDALGKFSKLAHPQFESALLSSPQKMHIDQPQEFKLHRSARVMPPAIHNECGAGLLMGPTSRAHLPRPDATAACVNQL